MSRTATPSCGLQDVGWTGDPRLVRLAMCASAIKYDWLAPSLLARAASGDRAVGYGGARVEDVQRLFRERAAALDFLTARAAEARQLATELELDELAIP